jgi:hypothetical protein
MTLAQRRHNAKCGALGMGYRQESFDYLVEGRHLEFLLFTTHWKGQSPLEKGGGGVGGGGYLQSVLLKRSGARTHERVHLY